MDLSLQVTCKEFGFDFLLFIYYLQIVCIVHSIFSVSSRFTLKENNDDREILATGQNLEDFKTVSANIKEKYLPYHTGQKHFENNENITRCGFHLILPPWICQPYVRMSPENYTQKMEKLCYNQVT